MPIYRLDLIFLVEDDTGAGFAFAYLCPNLLPLFIAGPDTEWKGVVYATGPES